MITTEIKDVLAITFPQIVYQVIYQLINVVNTSVIGHLGTSSQVAGAGMAIMTL